MNILHTIYALQIALAATLSAMAEAPTTNAKHSLAIEARDCRCQLRELGA